tara:strand:+ start:1448 stop:2551 length:1104 start_codon:yes stop_codon:yes gene_type:complete
MEQEIVTADVEAESNPTENTNISASEFVLKRSDALKTSPEEKSKDQSESVNQESTEEIPEVSEMSEEQAPLIEPTESVSEENVLSQLNLESLSDEELKALREKLIPGAQSRIAELTAKRKTAEEQLNAVQAKTQELELQKPEVKNNPFRNIETINDLQSKSNEVNNIIDWAEDILFKSDQYSPEEEVTTVDGKSLTKIQVRDALKNARKSRDVLIPDQLSHLRQLQNSVQLRQELGSQAINELNWLQGEKPNELKEKFVGIMSDPRLKEIEKQFPDIGSQLPYFMAHATNSIYGRKLIDPEPASAPAKKTASQPQLNPPSSATPSAASSAKSDRPSNKQLKELDNRFKRSGQTNDFVTFRTLQLKNR